LDLKVARHHNPAVVFGRAAVPCRLPLRLPGSGRTRARATAGAKLSKLFPQKWQTNDNNSQARALIPN
jgi:hypothetical protein